MTKEIDISRYLNLDINPLILITGASRTGKSYFLESIMKKTFGRKYDKIVYLNPSFKISSTRQQWIDWIGRENIHHDDTKIENPEYIENIIKDLQKLKQNDKGMEILFVMDDLGPLFSKLKRKDGDFLDKMASRFRHIGTCICLIQDLTQVSKFVRKNTTHIVFCKTTNNSVIDLACEDFSNGMEKKEIKQLFRKTFFGDLKKKYNKILINVYDGYHISFIN